MTGNTGSGVVMFVPLHTRSHYSPGDGVAPVDALVRRAATHGYAALAGCIPTAELAARAGRLARVAGIVAATRCLVSRGGRVMQFVTLEDEAGLVECVLFPRVYAELADPVTTPGRSWWAGGWSWTTATCSSGSPMRGCFMSDRE